MNLILIGIGANLSSPQGSPRKTCGAALLELEKNYIKISKRSYWYHSAPVAQHNQPWYINAAVSLKTHLSPGQLLDKLLLIEKKFGRKRGQPNAARTIDLDILTFSNLADTLKTSAGNNLTVPHPNLKKRAFVLLPIRDIDANWCHPIDKLSVHELLEQLPIRQKIKRIEDSNGLFGTEFYG